MSEQNTQHDYKVGEVIKLVGSEYTGKILSISRDGDNQLLYAIEMPHHAITEGGHEPVESVSQALITPNQ